MSRQWILHVLVSLLCITGHLSRWRGKGNFRVFQKTDCIPFNSYKIQVVEFWACRLLTRIDGQQTKPSMNLLIVHSVFMCFRIPICRVLGWGFVVLPADVTHRHFHHLTFLPRKVSPKPSRLRSFRETIIPLCKSAGNRRNWWHHGCQSWTLRFVKRKVICCYTRVFRLKTTSYPDWRVLAENQRSESDLPLLRSSVPWQSGQCRVYVALKCSFQEINASGIGTSSCFQPFPPKNENEGTPVSFPAAVPQIFELSLAVDPRHSICCVWSWSSMVPPRGIAQDGAQKSGNTRSKIARELAQISWCQMVPSAVQQKSTKKNGPRCFGTKVCYEKFLGVLDYKKKQWL